MVLGKVLELDVSSCPAAASGGAVETEHAPGPSVTAYGAGHGAVLGKGRFLRLSVEGKGLPHGAGRIGEQSCHFFFGEGFRMGAVG